MVKYTCPTCLKEFSKKSHYIVHTEKKKNPCQPIAPITLEKLQNSPKGSLKAPENLKKNDKIDIGLLNNTEKLLNSDIVCNYCEKVFCKKSNLTRHLNTNRCVVKRKVDEDEEIIFEKDKVDKTDTELKEVKQENLQLKKEVEELKKMFFEFSKQNNKKVTKKIINNTQNNNNNNTNIQTLNNNNTVT